MQHDFISLGFHGSRVSLFGKPNFGYFGTELVGEFFYNNPVNFVLAILAIVAAFRGKISLAKSVSRLMLCIALPLIAVFLFFSLTRPTLPHWNSPAYNLLILLSACMFSSKRSEINHRVAIPKSIIAAMAVLLLVVGIGSAEIQTGFIPLDHNTEAERLGQDDFTLDMYGWRQLGTKFADFREEKIDEGLMRKEDGIVADQWFPLANIDYYVARPLHMRVMGLGKPENLHKYIWINENRGGFHSGENYWFLSDSRYMKKPNELYPNQFNAIELVGIIPIERGGRTVKNFFVYTCKGYSAPPSSLP
jgi:hypothetical protein